MRRARARRPRQAVARRGRARDDIDLPAAAQEHGDDAHAHGAAAQHECVPGAWCSRCGIFLPPNSTDRPGAGQYRRSLIARRGNDMSGTYKDIGVCERRSCRRRRDPAAAAQFLRQFADQPDRRRLRGVRPRQQHPRLCAVRPGQVVLRRRRFRQPAADRRGRERQAPLQGGDPPVPLQEAQHRRRSRARRSAAASASP